MRGQRQREPKRLGPDPIGRPANVEGTVALGDGGGWSIGQPLPLPDGA